jgi:quercetin dioxygenase-like cupin family protein
MHKTNSIDYGVVLDGEICLELDDAQERQLQKHDVVVQNGNRHAWRNRSDKPATVLFVLIGAERAA